jgi:hypothetical protein
MSVILHIALKSMLTMTVKFLIVVTDRSKYYLVYIFHAVDYEDEERRRPMTETVNEMFM